MIEAVVHRVQQGHDLQFEEMSGVIDLMMQGQVDPSAIEQLLLGLRAKGETADELAGAALAMRKHMTPIVTRHSDVLDTCGTGGAGAGTFNISTAAALVACAAGAKVAKHGNRKISSKSGSADVLLELGVNIQASVPVVQRCLDEIGICFCFAPLMHGAMKHIAPVRQKLGVPTIFNLLGPLCNPARSAYQLIGVGRSDARSILGQALTRLETKRSAVVHGRDGLGEISNADLTDVVLVHGDQCTEEVWSAEQFGVQPSDLESLKVDTPAQSAERIRHVLDGHASPARDIVVINAAAALWVAEIDSTLLACAGRAAEAIDSGGARNVLGQLVEASHTT